MKYAVLGAGNGGQAISGWLSIQGHDVWLYDRSESKVAALSKKKEIRLQGAVDGVGKLTNVSNDIHSNVKDADVIMVVTTADAHAAIARDIAGDLGDGQMILLNPGRTCGALEFKRTLEACGCSANVLIAEAQTLIYAARLVEDGVVNIIGVKDKVLVSAVPATDTQSVLNKVQPDFPMFCPVMNVLRTSLENIGAMFHPCVLMFNAATIERNDVFWFYRDMTEQVAGFIEKFDAERLAVGKAYGIDLLSVSDWISYAYPGTSGTTLCEKMKNNPAYHEIKSPSTIFTRQLTEDIPTGVLPIMELGEVAGVPVPLMQSMVNVCEALLNMDLRSKGRTLENLGLDGKSKDEIISYLSR